MMADLQVCVIADLPAPQAGGPVPRVITFQRKRANRRVINEDQLVRMLREFAEVGSGSLAAPSVMRLCH